MADDGAHAHKKKPGTADGDHEPAKDEPIVVGWRGVAAIVALAVLISGALWVVNGQIPAPTIVEPASPVATSAQLAYYLGRWGLVLTVVGFVLLSVAQVMRSYRFPAPATLDAEAAPWDKLFDAIPLLIKSPVGVGMALILTAATLLVASAAASNDNAAPSQSPTASPAAAPAK